jgi:phytoene dehydrogenase-like protein
VALLSVRASAHDSQTVIKTANIVGAGVNGLSAAIVLAQAGVRVTVWEAEPQAGGAARTLPLTLPDFLHDFGAAVLPLAAGSPFFQQLPLQQYGLEWVHSPVPLAHPLDGGDAILLRRDLDEACNALAHDGNAWRRLVGSFVPRWNALAHEILQPPLHISKSPFLLGAFGARAMLPANWTATNFRSPKTKALWAGMAAHSFLRLNAPGSSAAGLALAVTAHAQGWPIARGGTQSLVYALTRHLESLGGTVQLNALVKSLKDIPPAQVTLFDTSPRQFLAIVAGANMLKPRFISRLRPFRPGPGSFKLDYALSRPIPWAATECATAATVHLGGTFTEIAISEQAVANRTVADKPFVLLAQPTLFDPSRAPEGKHIAWAYCHVPYGYRGDATDAIERQIERFAPGFRDCVLARRALTPAAMEARDANLHGGDISGGAMDPMQMFFRPTARGYATSNPALWLCSASTSPGGGVHGMCGANAARAVLRMLG